jgi:hypothetical protein
MRTAQLFAATLDGKAIRARREKTTAKSVLILPDLIYPAGLLLASLYSFMINNKHYFI